MSKYTSRVDSLIKKTHIFVSQHDFCIMRDYFHARFEEEEKPSDFDERIKELETLEKQLRSDDPKIKSRIDEIIEASLAVRLKTLLPYSVQECEKFPHGVWLPKWYACGVPKLVKDGKKYLADRKVGNSEL